MNRAHTPARREAAADVAEERVAAAGRWRDVLEYDVNLLGQASTVPRMLAGAARRS